MTKLKACPFCGGKGQIVQDDRTGLWSVMCVDCSATGGASSSVEGAVYGWDERSYEDKEILGATISYLQGLTDGDCNE